MSFFPFTQRHFCTSGQTTPTNDALKTLNMQATQLIVKMLTFHPPTKTPTSETDLLPIGNDTSSLQSITHCTISTIFSSSFNLGNMTLVRKIFISLLTDSIIFFSQTTYFFSNIRFLKKHQQQPMIMWKKERKKGRKRDRDEKHYITIITKLIIKRVQGLRWQWKHFR